MVFPFMIAVVQPFLTCKGRFVLSTLVLLMVSVVLMSCASPDSARRGLFPSRNAILLWHNLSEPDASALNNVIDRYRRANADIEIVVQLQDATMEEAFMRAVRSGLGPNLLLTSSPNVRALADANALVQLESRVSEDVAEHFLSVALRTLRYNGHLYGLPMAIDTQVLYFNRELVERPAATVDQLLQEAASGRRVLMNSQFTDAVWSARTFGVELFDAEGNAQDTTGGIANWLTWMEQVRDTPGFIIDDNTPALRERFMLGDIPYYIGHSYELNQLSDALGLRLGVAQLPSGPAGSAGPLLTTATWLINAMSSTRQIDLALDLAQFISSSDQQAALMREADIVPANARTRISEGLYPHITTITAQARTAIPYSNDGDIQNAFAVLATAYNRTMAGTTSATEAAIAAQITLIEELGFPDTEITATLCVEQGDLVVLAPDSSALLTVLRTVTDHFSDVCPGIRTTIRAIPDHEFPELTGSSDDLADVDLIFVPHSELRRLAGEEIVAPITQLLDPALQQQMRPIAAAAMRIDNDLYGAPVLIDMQTFYYNSGLIDDAAGTLADLRAQAQSNVPVALDGAFEHGFWGVAAFGGRLFTEDGQFALSPTALTEWLAWLQESQQDFGVRIISDRNAMIEQFTKRDSAYLVASSLRYNELLSLLGSETLSVALFPQGPVGPGRPLAAVSGVAMRNNLSARQARLASRFLSYIAGVRSQNELLLAHRIMPANSAVLLDRNPNVARMVEQLQLATLIQPHAWLDSVFSLGDQAYTSVLVDGVAPADAVGQMYAALGADAVNTGIVLPTPDPTPTPTVTLTPTPAEEPMFAPSAAPVDEGVDEEQSTERDIPQETPP